MEIITENLGKKFRNEWIFKSVNLRFQQGQSYTFTGSNGSGKSTFLQILSGFIPASEGKILAFKNQLPSKLSKFIRKSVSQRLILSLLKNLR
jgi:ABC-type multidrug transport system ATPase subunit